MPFNSFIRSIKRAVDLIFMPFSFIYRREVDYEVYWASRASNINKFNSFQQYRYKWLLKQVEPGTSLLDIGCGDGQLLRMLQSQGIKGTGADVSEYTRNCLKDTDISFIKLDKENVQVCNINSSFDYITMFEFLEHTNNPEDIIIHLLQYANKSVMFSIPNSGFISYRIRLLLGKFPRQWKVNPSEHLRFWSLSDLNDWLVCLNISSRNYVIYAYEGIPLLNKLFPGLFAMGLIVRIDVN